MACSRSASIPTMSRHDDTTGANAKRGAFTLSLPFAWGLTTESGPRRSEPAATL